MRRGSVTMNRSISESGSLAYRARVLQTATIRSPGIQDMYLQYFEVRRNHSDSNSFGSGFILKKFCKFRDDIAKFWRIFGIFSVFPEIASFSPDFPYNPVFQKT